jgi:nucleotide-binding universal stress UspA family protein
MNRFKNILAYINTHSERHSGFEKALELAASNRARLTVIDIAGEFPFSPRSQEIRQVILNEKQEKLFALRERALQSGLDITAHLASGKSFLEIIRLVMENDHDLVVKTADMPETAGSTIFSTTDKHLLRKCPCPVWLVRPGRNQLFKRIVAAVDPTAGDPKKDWLNRRILELALSLTEREAAELSIVHAWSASGETLMRGRYSAQSIDEYVHEMRSISEKKMHSLLEEFDIPLGDPRVVLRKGQPASTIVRFAKEVCADCLIMGTLARKGISGLLIGNTAEEVLDSVGCSILTLKPEGFVSPVGESLLASVVRG